MTATLLSSRQSTQMTECFPPVTQPLLLILSALLDVPFSEEKNSNRNQTDTNEMATTETKYQNRFLLCQKYQYITKF